MSKTVVVTLTDYGYYHRARRTLLDIRTRGKWAGDLVLITVGFSPSRNFLDYYDIIDHSVTSVDVSILVEEYKKNPLKTVLDQRHLNKLAQWNKFHVFDDFFKKWDKVIFFDAGMRVLDKVSILDSLQCEGKILAPDDSTQTQRFEAMFEVTANKEVEKLLLEEFPKEILRERYFLNCIWVYDTAIIDKCGVKEMVEYMNKYPICRCNEMTIMNLLLVFKYKLWKPFPSILNDKSFYCWTEESGKTWRDYYYLKYPRTINFDCD